MARILIVAGGRWQVPIIRTAKRLGHDVVNTNLYPDSPGFRYADRSYVVDVLDKEKNLAIARRHKVRAVLTDQTDLAVRTVAYVADSLGLPSIGADKAGLFSNKLRMRRFCRDHGFASPAFAPCRTAGDVARFLKAVGPPIVIKPVDSQGSRGIRRIWNPLRIPEALRDTLTFSRDGAVLAERYLPGTELAVDGFSVGGRHTTLSVSKKAHYRTTPASSTKIFYAPSDPAFDYPALRALNDSLVDRMGLPFGVTHAEYKFSGGKFQLIEVAARGGGNHISSHIVPLVSGIDVGELLIRCALGERVDPPRPSPSPRICLLEWFVFESGRVRAVRGVEAVRKMDGVVDIALSFKPGDILAPPRNDTDRPGYFIATAESKRALRALAGRIKSEIKVDYA